MRITIDVDSATPDQVYDLTLAYQRTSGLPLPGQITKQPTVTVGGSAMGWKSPALYPEQARKIMLEFDSLQKERERPLAPWEEELLGLKACCSRCEEGE